LIADIAKEQKEDSWEAAEALRVANEMVNACHLENPDTFAKASLLAEQYFQGAQGRKSQNQGFTLTAVGHCHIDTAWLWPYAETKRKCARSWITQIRLMEEFSSYLFAASQAQQYDWMKREYPQIFTEIQSAAERGQFLPVGGTWVEMDCNLPSGESLVRQFLYGQRFFKEHFPTCAPSPIFWLPDTFGYAAQLPQIIRGAGMEFFLTQKLSWNQVNKFPHSTFVWEGLDGSRVITHFPPADNYCSHATPADLLKSEWNCKDKERSNEALLVYGHGDGGGGPNPKMLELLTRAEKTASGGLPNVRLGSPVDFFYRLAEREEELCVWSGELYFEYHRGTYTTQAKNKLHNRRAEERMREIELLSTCTLFCGDSVDRSLYDREAIEKWWKLILLNQFHDVIPGTSIQCVFEDSAVHYASVFAESGELHSRLVNQLAGSGSTPHWFVSNPLSWDRRELVEIPSSDDGKSLALVSVPSCGFAVIGDDALQATVAPDEAVTLEEKEDQIIMENKWVRVVLHVSGHVASMIWKPTGREVIKPSKENTANHMLLFDDNPLFWDAWDVDVYHLEKKIQFHSQDSVQWQVVEKGPLRVSVRFDIPISKESIIQQTISLDCCSALLKFDNIVQWHEAHKFLKVQFPLAIRTQQCTYEIPYGWVQRPTHFNTSWDMAKFEVCAHHFADLAEYGFGVALVNDSKYGYSARDNVLTLSLLRSPKAPDETADMGEQRFSYGLLPHEDSFQAAGVISQASQFNNPLKLQQVESSSSRKFSFVSIENCGAVVVDTVKLAEDSDDVIVRLFESHGGSQLNVGVSFGTKIQRAAVVNLLEEGAWEDKPLEVNGNSITVNFNAFEIITIKITMG